MILITKKLWRSFFSLLEKLRALDWKWFRM